MLCCSFSSHQHNPPTFVRHTSSHTFITGDAASSDTSFTQHGHARLRPVQFWQSIFGPVAIQSCSTCVRLPFSEVILRDPVDRPLGLHNDPGQAKIEGDRIAKTRVWKLFGLVPIILFHRTKWSGTIGRDELVKRADDITEGRWLGLVEAINSLMREPQSGSTIQEDSNSSRERSGLQAQIRVQQGQVSRARQALVGAALAPGNNATLEELQRRRPQVALSEIPPELLNCNPESVLVLDRKLFAECLQKAPTAPQARGLHQ